jgi:hypothetical protein
MFIPALRVFSYVDVEVMLISAPHERVLAETGAATTNRLVSTAMVKTTPNILDNFVFIYLFKILLIRISICLYKHNTQGKFIPRPKYRDQVFYFQAIIVESADSLPHGIPAPHHPLLLVLPAT